MSEKEILNGFEIRLAPYGSDPAVPRAKLAAALDLIGTHAPARLARLQRDIRRFLVRGITEEGFIGRWRSYDRTCELNADYLLEDSSSAESVAMVIMHEGVHARLESYGIQGMSSSRARVERLCRRAELEFAERIADPSLLQRVRDDHQIWEALPASFWTDEERRRRYDGRRAAILARLGVPAWLIRALGGRTKRAA